LLYLLIGGLNMSRIGKLPIVIPSGVTVSQDNGLITVKGPKGEMSQKVDSSIKVSIENGHILFEVDEKSPVNIKQKQAFHGLYRSLVNNMVVGVSEGYKKVLELVGVGYRVSNQGNLIEFSLGYTHPIFIQLPSEVKVETKSERNQNLSSPMEIFQTLIYAFSKTKKPQSYIYPYKKVETDKRLQAVANLSFFASDGDKVYYKGEVLENVDLNTLVPIDGQYTYFTDKENVYYHSKLLPIKNSGNLKVVSLNPDDKFLYDEINGYVFIGDYSFDREKTPYKIIGSNGTHLYSLIFVSDDGIYFYDSENKKQVRLKDNIFVGNIEEISPNVFTDNENIYYFQNYEIWKKYKNRGSFLASRNTEVYSLGKKESWKKLVDIGNENIGSLWEKDNEYYYFDNLENSSLKVDYRSAIYKITDKSTLESLLSYSKYINVEKIDEFILNKNFEDAKGEKLFTATIKFHNVLKIFLGVLLVLGFIFIVFFLYLNKLNKEDKKNIDKMLLEKYRNIKPISKDYNNKE